MRSFGVVVFSPLFNEDLCFTQAVEDFAIQELVAEPGIEAFAVPVLPGAAWFDVSRFGPDRLDPILYSLRNELRAAIGAYERRHAAQDEQITQDVDDIALIKFPVDTDRQAFSTVLINDVQCAERSSVIRSAMHKVIAPHMIAMLRPEPDARSIVQPEPPFLWLFHRHFQPLSSP